MGQRTVPCRQKMLNRLMPICRHPPGRAPQRSSSCCSAKPRQSKRLLTRENPRESSRIGLRPAFQRLQPLARFFAQLRKVDTAERRRKGFEPTQNTSQQRNSSAYVSGLQMMKGRGDLNQRLQKSFLRLLQSQPYALPVFVGKPEFPVSIAANALRQRAGLPVERHNVSIRHRSLKPSPRAWQRINGNRDGPFIARPASSPAVHNPLILFFPALFPIL
jgi:hypothetical protein